MVNLPSGVINSRFFLSAFILNLLASIEACSWGFFMSTVPTIFIAGLSSNKRGHSFNHVLIKPAIEIHNLAQSGPEGLSIRIVFVATGQPIANGARDFAAAPKAREHNLGVVLFNIGEPRSKSFENLIRHLEQGFGRSPRFGTKIPQRSVYRIQALH